MLKRLYWLFVEFCSLIGIRAPVFWVEVEYQKKAPVPIPIEIEE